MNFHFEPAASDSIPPLTDKDDGGCPQTPDILTRPATSLPPPVPALPTELRVRIGAGGCSAVRAWRVYRGLSSKAVAERSQLNLYTLHAIEFGFVGLCEWTVAPIARALRIAEEQLLLAQQLADHTAESPSDAPLPSMIPERPSQP